MVDPEAGGRVNPWSKLAFIRQGSVRPNSIASAPSGWLCSDSHK
jgi:hypothetical protein